jgi:c-di-GMP-related signal transduction protein
MRAAQHALHPRKPVTSMNDMTHSAAALSLITMTSYLGRQPILDRQGQLVAYELLFRPFDTPNAQTAADADPDANPDDDASPQEGIRETADIVVETLGELGIETVLGEHVGYINAGRDWLMHEMFTLLPPGNFVIEIHDAMRGDAQLVQRMLTLSGMGYRFAIDDIRDNARPANPASDCADFVKIVVPHWKPDTLRPFVMAMHRVGKQVIAEQVDTPDDYRWTYDAGCDLFQGYYFAHPHLLAVRRIPPLRQALIQLLVLLGAEPSLQSVEDEVKRNPALTVQLLRFVSSARLAGARQRLQLRDAVQLVGTDWLRRWALLALYTDGNTRAVASNALVQLVGTRARFMELAARRLKPNDEEFADNAFMTGMTSLLPVVLQRNAVDLFAELQLALPVRAAIEAGAGVLGRLLACAEALENPITATAIVTQLCVDLAPLNATTMSLLSAAAANWMADRTRF